MYFLNKAHKTQWLCDSFVQTAPDKKNYTIFVNDLLKLELDTFPSYPRDKKDLLLKLQHLQLPKDCLLATVDMSSQGQPAGDSGHVLPLFKHPTKGGNGKVSSWFYYYFPDCPFPRASLMKCMQLILKHNVFTVSPEEMLLDVSGRSIAVVDAKPIVFPRGD